MSKLSNILMKTAVISLTLIVSQNAFAAFNPLVTTDGGSIDETIDGEQNVNSGGIVYNATVTTNGIQNINDGGIAINTTVTGAGGLQNVNNGGRVSNTTISGVGEQIIYDGGTADGNTLLTDKGTLFVLAGGTLAGNLTLRGDTLGEDVGGNITANIDMHDTSRMFLLDGTISGNLVLNDSSLLYFINGGTISGNITMHDDSVQNLTKGTISGSTTLYGNSIQNVGENGIAWNTTINTNTLQIVSSGGIAIDTIINNGGRQVVNDGAIIGGTTTINSGGILTHAADEFSVLLEAQDSSSGIILNGGTIAISAPASASMTINPTVTGTGVLQINKLDSLNFVKLSGDFTVYIPDLDNLYSNAFIFYDSTDGVNFTLDSRSAEIGEHKAKIIDNGPTLGISIVEDLDLPADFVHNIGRASGMNLAILESLSNSMHKRMGEIQWMNTTNNKKPMGVFVRAIASGLSLSGIELDNVTLTGLEFGIDKQILNTDKNKLFLGIMGQYANGDQTYDNDFIDGSGNLNSYALGLYMSWLSNKGYFIDVTARGYRLSNRITDYSNMSAIDYDTSQYAIVGSLEAGRQILLDKNNDDNFSWIIVPRAQMNAGYLSSDKFTISNGIEAHIDDSQIFNLSTGLITGPRFAITRWTDTLLQPYIKASIKYEFQGRTHGGTTDLSMSDDSIHGAKYELGLGANLLADSKWSLYADSAWQFGSNYKSFSGTIGLRAIF